MEIQKSVLQIVAFPEFVPNCGIHVFGQFGFDLPHDPFVDQMGHMGGNVPFYVSKQSNQLQIGENQRITVRVRQSAISLRFLDQ